MSSNRVAVSVPPAVDSHKSTVSLVLVMPHQLYQSVALNRQSLGISWPNWFGQALALLSRESPAEIESLLTTVAQSAASDKRLSLRLRPADLELVRNLAVEYGVPQRNVLIMAASLKNMQVVL